jgi:hypothetical protein
MDLEIDHAKKIGQELGARGVIIIAIGETQFRAVSYGKTRLECEKMKGILNALVDRLMECFEGKINVRKG